jgi:predicted DNA-binding transcriptional regulator AlpA
MSNSNNCAAPPAGGRRPPTGKSSQVDLDRLWTVKDVSTFLQVSTSWVYQRSASGELPSLKVGGLLRFDPGAIRNWTGIS